MTGRRPGTQTPLAGALQERGLGYDDAARAAKVSVGYLREVGAGDHWPSPRVQARLADWLGVDVDELFPAEHGLREARAALDALHIWAHPAALIRPVDTRREPGVFVRVVDGREFGLPFRNYYEAGAAGDAA